VGEVLALSSAACPTNYWGSPFDFQIRRSLERFLVSGSEMSVEEVLLVWLSEMA